MQTIDFEFFRKYLVSDKSFTDIIRSIFSNVLQMYAGISGVKLSQIKEDGELVRIVEGGRIIDDEDAHIRLPIIIGHVPAMELLACCGNAGVGRTQLMNVANIALAIQSIAVKKVSESNSAPASLRQTEIPESTPQTPVEQPAAKPAEPAPAAVDESAILATLEDVYGRVFRIIEKVPTGIAVLDDKNEQVIYMNKAAEENIPAQNAMGMALAKYERDKNEEVGQILDEDSGVSYDVTFVPIQWPNGSEVLLGAALDVK